MSWQAATAVMLQERLGLEKYVTAQMYYSLVGRGLEYEFQSFAEYHNIGILVWSALAGGFLSGKYSRTNPAPDGTRFAEGGSQVRMCACSTRYRTRVFLTRSGWSFS
jgi:aryl-alcohol dehydrogenase-like predicted oxidoreductase